jgi:RNA polymerase sigma-70 factor (ECF subfamily)
MNPAIVEWVTSNFLPFEADIRRLLRRVCSGPEEIDDVIQEVYYKVLMMESLDHVQDPKPFLLTMARNLVFMRIRRDAIVSIEAVANLDELEIADASPTPERVALARAELQWVLGLVASLPERCRHVFHARRIDGLSQRETADKLGISEGSVESETLRGLKLIQKMVADVGLSDQAACSQARVYRPEQRYVRH